MKTFEQWILDEFNETVPSPSIEWKWFSDHNLPIIVQCTCCECTLALPAARIDEEGRVYCSLCAE